MRSASQAVDAHAAEFNLAGRRLDPASNGLEQRRLTDAVATENSEHLAVAHGQVDALDNVAWPIMRMQLTDFEHGQACPK